MLSSRGTSAHETGIRFSTLSPYEYLYSQGIILTSFAIRILPKPRKNGVAITCRADVSGIIYTVGAANYDTLMAELLDDIQRHRASIERRQKRKHLLNTDKKTIQYIDRHPDAMILPAYLC